MKLLKFLKLPTTSNSKSPVISWKHCIPLKQHTDHVNMADVVAILMIATVLNLYPASFRISSELRRILALNHGVTRTE